MQLRFCYSMYYCMLLYPISFYIFRCRFLNVSLSAAILPPPPPCMPPTAPACVLPGAHIGLLICRCRPSALLIYLCASLNGRRPSGVRLWPTLSGCLHLVGVNVAINNTGAGKGTENIKRAYGLNGIFSVPVFDFWRH